MCISPELDLYVIPKGQADTSRINETAWMTNTTVQPTADILSTYSGFVFRRLSNGTGVIVNVNSGNCIQHYYMHNV